ncbi:SPOR domain-containing protein [Methylobrevis sp. L22]|uniref:SPOR domain-containing protein n=2 Tax=Methylobrevis albus TaxID=2793297 RepID=A0A931I679_9HYPH|nr:SPOR domain-containing protein [Methylobrevis albus]
MAAAAQPAAADSKYAAIVVDITTGKVLYEASANERRYPASLTKMMTLYVLFEELERGRFTLDSRLKISSNAAAEPPSKIGLKPGSTIRVEDAIKALVTKSANDIATAIGENVAGSQRAFADRMTRTARAIGMRGSQFRNAHGLPNDSQFTTARDMMTLGVALQVRFPRYYEYFKTRSFTLNGRTYGNHNRLLGKVEGVDGIKTGFIRASGFNLVSSVKRGDRKVVAVVMGGASAASRDAHMRELIETYLPKASRGRGIEERLVAAAVQTRAPVAAKEMAIPVVTATQAVAALAPTPRQRPLMPSQEIVTASIMPATPRISRQQPVTPLTAPMPTSLADATLPSSAVEAFADVGEGDAEIADDGLPVPVPMPAASIPQGVEVAMLTPTTPQATRPAVTGGWQVQIGAVDSERSAMALLRKAQERVGNALIGASPTTEMFTKGNSTFVRARFAGFRDADAAARACDALKKKDFNCYAVRL